MLVVANKALMRKACGKKNDTAEVNHRLDLNRLCYRTSQPFILCSRETWTLNTDFVGWVNVLLASMYTVMDYRMSKVHQQDILCKIDMRSCMKLMMKRQLQTVTCDTLP